MNSHLSAEIIHRGENEKQKLNNLYVFGFNNLKTSFLAYKLNSIITGKMGEKAAYLLSSSLERDYTKYSYSIMMDEPSSVP